MWKKGMPEEKNGEDPALKETDLCLAFKFFCAWKVLHVHINV